jgi:type IV pilus assembly protein PilW
VDIDAVADPGDGGGVSLADLLVSLTITGLVLGATFTALDAGQRLYARGAAQVEAQQSARVAVERLAREIRQAGHGAVGLDAVSVAEPSRIVLHVDVDGDGLAAGPSETVTWQLVGRILRRSAGAGAQPVIGGVRDFALAYLDRHGRPTTDAAEVRVVTLRLETEPDRAAAGAPLAVASFATSVRLRNRPRRRSGHGLQCRP